MDIQMICDAINELQTGETNMRNITDLANLYIVADKLLSAANNPVQSELDDILPAYRSYLNIKRKYQFHEVSEGAVIKAMNTLCTELFEFIDILYRNTDMNRERKPIQELSEKLCEKFSKKG